MKPSPNSTPKQNELVGPWNCEQCPEMKFDDYLTFRRHLQETHNERLDARVCEYCGYKASKRNLHLYHLFTKHNVPPPKNIKFPKCTECDYIALSESLLSKHANSHQIRCDICKVSMKTLAALQAHKVTCKPGNEVRNIICDLCKRAFRTNVSLNAHLKECQGKATGSGNIFGDDGEQQSVEMIEVPIIRAVDVDKNDHTLVQIPSGIILAENQNMALLPSSESEGLNNVATGIATSIGLTVSLPQDQQTVILLDGNSEFFLQGNEPIVVHKHASQEYIVPELLDSSFTTTANIAYAGTDQVIYLGSSSTSDSHQEVIHLEEIKLDQPTPGTSTGGEKVIIQQKKPDNGTPTSGTAHCLKVPKDVLIAQNLTIVNDQTSESGEITLAEGNKHKPSTVTTSDYEQQNRDIQNEIKRKLSESQLLKFEENNNGSGNTSASSNGNGGTKLIGPHYSGNRPVKRPNSQSLAEPSKVDKNMEFNGNETGIENNKKSQQNDLEEGIDLITNKVNSKQDRHQITLPDEKLADEEMLVDDNEDEEMEAEENIDLNRTKDVMVVGESDKTGDEKVDSLVKDWGFDDEDTEEVVDDPDYKPLRPEIDIPL